MYIYVYIYVYIYIHIRRVIQQNNERLRGLSYPSTSFSSTSLMSIRIRPCPFAIILQ